MGKMDIFNLVLTKLNIELGLAQPQLVIKHVSVSTFLIMAQTSPKIEVFIWLKINQTLYS